MGQWGTVRTLFTFTQIQTIPLQNQTHFKLQQEQTLPRFLEG